MPRPRYHTALALSLAAITVATTRRPKDALPILVAGVLVDLDHLVDYAYYRLRGPGRFFAPLHGWEYVLGLISSAEPFRRLLAAGLASHLALDQIHAPRNPLAYWVLYRLSRRFDWQAMGFRAVATENWKDTPWWKWF